MTEWINVSDITPRIAYTATAAQTNFAVPFVFFENSNLVVYQNGDELTLDAEYAVFGAEDEAGGTITLTTGATVGDQIMIVRDVPVEQTTHIPPSGPLDIPAINIQLSKFVAMIQQLYNGLARSLRLPDNVPGELTIAEPVAGEYLKWNATEDGIESTAIVTPAGSYAIATQSEAVAGTLNDVLMTPLRTAQAINGYFDDRTFATRALAIAATISADVDFIRTLAYDANYTENSGAVFKRVPAGTPFLDTYPTAGTITAGAGYTNGTYYGAFLTGSATGTGLASKVTVAGGVVTAVDFSKQPGNGYKVGDVLTCANTSIGNTGSGFAFTLTTISTPLASFVNTVDSSRWQYIESKGAPHINEFGAYPDWFGADASSTNNFPAVQAALFYAVRRNWYAVNEDAGGYAGNVVKAGVGSYMLLHPSNDISLVVPNGVWLEGCYGSTFKFHDSWFGATHTIVIGNSDAHFANFNCGVRRMRLWHARGVSAALGTYLIYSNNAQDNGGVEDCYLYPSERGGIRYEIGYGGASTVKFHNLSINLAGATPAFTCTVGTTLADCRTWSLNAPSSGSNVTVDAIVLNGTGGMYKFENIHMEGFPNGFNLDLRAGNQPMATFKNITGGGLLDWVFTVQGTSEAGSYSFEQVNRNNGLGLGVIANGLGVSRTTNIKPADGIIGI